jgi:magnesium transporter
MNAHETTPLEAGETAGSLASSRFPVARMGDTADAVWWLLRNSDFDAVDFVTVTDDDGRYEGVAPLAKVLRAADRTAISALVDRDWPCIGPGIDQEHAVEAAQAARVPAIPVVGDDRRPIGVIPAARLLAALAHEHREDVHRLVGIMSERAAGARHALEDPPLRRVARRLPWLLVGLAMSTGATAVMVNFERALQANIMLAFFIPALVYLTDAIGTQTEAIAVRGLSLRERPLAQILVGEIATGGIIGLALGSIAFLGVWLAFSDMVVAFGIGLSLLAAGTLASTIGLLLPWVLSRLDVDPAFGSGPVGTIVQDVLTILVYFAIMTQMLAAA